jgi:uncharacterized coiled-coil protein SlyX
MRPVVRVVFLLAPRRPVQVRLIESSREALVSPTDAPDTQAGAGSPDDGATHVIEPTHPSIAHTHAPRYWRGGLALALLALLGVGLMQGIDIVHDLQARSTRLELAVAQQQEQQQALSFTLHALRTEFGIVTDELVSDRANVPVQSEPADLAAVALSPTETRSLTSLMEQVSTQSAQLTTLAKEVAQMRTVAQTREPVSRSRYRAPTVTPSEPVPPQDAHPPYAVTLPPALGVAGFPPARPRRARAPR